MKIGLNEYKNLELEINKGDIIFLYGDLGAGKTSFIQNILNNRFGIEEKIKSPTYVHYKKYLENIYHFDLYRFEEYDEFVNVGGEEILDDKENISFIEWPELIEEYYKPKYRIYLNKIDGDDEYRDMIIKDK
ncbi:MAG: tRNA (adenosine(37)-N6)-threonylcarbamoyltransferase complex ATPase subunit type 1 TsaE [Candidatus Gracilibacteria bacterium]|nr:tRNA (adenosine(37)-N6)-threonylcarbamoyltransferase complex ATPase subunit type 1 TsaE [Candidatus Gracilibacteria bacterium]